MEILRYVLYRRKMKERKKIKEQMISKPTSLQGKQRPQGEETKTIESCLPGLRAPEEEVTPTVADWAISSNYDAAAMKHIRVKTVR